MTFTPDQSRKYFESRLSGQRLDGRRNAKCPLHNDRTASLSVNLEKGVWKCHAGCGQGGIIDFEMKLAACDRDTAWARISDILGIKQGRLSSRKIVAVYEYHDVAGRVLFEKVRYEPKEFSQRVPDGKGGYTYKLEGISKPLYRLPQVLVSNQIAICEGEKDADRLISTFAEKWPNFTATSTFDGAGKWKEEHAPYFHGKQVVVFADNDTIGIAHAETVARSVSKHAASVKVIRFSDVPEHGDVSDFLDKHKPDDLIKLIRETPRWNNVTPEADDGMFVSVADFVRQTPTEIDWIVEGVIQRGANGFICAEAKGGKSWSAADMLICLSKGIPWMGFKTAGPTRVAYISREDHPSLTAWRLQHLNAGKRLPAQTDETMATNFMVNTRAQCPELMLDNDEQLQKLIRALKRFSPEFVIFDVFNVFHAKDENDNSEMRAVLRQLLKVQAEVGCSVGVVHHYNKGTCESMTQRLRGASAIAGWAEWLIGISIADTDQRVRKMEFELKAASPPDPIYYQIQSDNFVAKMHICEAPHSSQVKTRKRTTEVIGDR